MYESDDEQSKREFYHQERNNNKNNNKIENDGSVTLYVCIKVSYVVLFCFCYFVNC